MQVTSNIVPSERGRKRLLRRQRLYIPDGNVFLQYSFDGTDPDPIGRITFNTPDGTKGVPMPNLLGYSTPDQDMGVMQNPDEIVISSAEYIVFSGRKTSLGYGLNMSS
ncbi:hypothetical protein AMATHDRAFT_68534 [Amanita thiersii Skay4041]|uniref:Uncharacterized protein n=1 Tax=Amanita thiersii Skay4041 TaxID=703135 RepID=A0A2A9N925_9AGAR|nr:hypothetical protein AMATHDRAFT_68534 [Amanita thiersii Skay4041]